MVAYIIFYIGINDASLLRFQSDNLQDGFIENPNKLESFFDNIKSRSFIIDLARKVKHQHYKRNESKRVIYDFMVEYFFDDIPTNKIWGWTNGGAFELQRERDNSPLKLLVHDN